MEKFSGVARFAIMNKNNMDKTVTNFYSKNPDQGYSDQYDKDHGKRIDWVVKRFGLDKLQNQRIVDIGAGKGNYFKRMSETENRDSLLDYPSNYYVGLDGALTGEKLCKFLSLRVDFNEPFGQLFDNEKPFDFLIASEVIEHIANINNVMLEMKKLLKVNGKALFTVPHVSVTHPTAFPGLFFPEQNFQIFIQQYGWIVEDFDVFQDGWKTCCFLVRNAPMSEQIPLFDKAESKFRGQEPINWANL